MTAVLALVGLGIMTGAGIFMYFGAYWWQLWEQPSKCGCVLSVVLRRPTKVNRKCELHGYQVYLQDKN